MPRSFGIALSAVAALIAVLSLAWRVPASTDMLARIAAPALSDRREFAFERATVADDGVVMLSGTVPSLKRISSMRWYVFGGLTQPERLRLDGNHFVVELLSSARRNAYPVYAYALDGTHVVALQGNVLVRPHAASQPQEPHFPLAAQREDPSIGARIAIDSAWIGDRMVPMVGAARVQMHDGFALKLIGWAIDTHEKAAAEQVEGVVDGVFSVVAYPDGTRPDVAAAYNDSGYTRSGFSITVPAARLRKGRHSLALRVLEGDRYANALEVKIDVTV